MPTLDPAIVNRIQTAYAAVQARIGAAAKKSGRKADDIALVAVTKYCDMDEVRALLSLGHLDLGESRAQQLEERAALLSGQTPDPIRWHMVGHMQRNKLKQVAPIAALIHSVDSLRLAEELHAFGAKNDLVLDVLVQVNSSGEESKGGVPPAAASHLVEQLESMAHLRVRGLMTMAAPAEKPTDLEEKVRPSFARTHEVFCDIRKAPFCNSDFNVLSMGMSSDFEIAIEEGANVVRIGSGLFGTK